MRSMQRLADRLFKTLAQVNYESIQVRPYKRSETIDVGLILMSNSEIMNKNIIENRASTAESFSITWENGPTIVVHSLLTTLRHSLPLIIRRIVMVYALIHDTTHVNTATIDVEIYLVDLLDKRMLPRAKNEPLTPMHVNGGSTWFITKTKRVVVVYREEEFFKVLCHELVHTYNLDAILDNSGLHRDFERYIMARSGIKTTALKLNEAYTDLVACLFHIACWSFDNIGNVKCNDKFRVLFKWAIKHGHMHMVRVASRIIRHFSSHTTNWKESTSAFSYYCCKAAVFNVFMTKMGKMKSWCLSEATARMFLELVVDALYDSSFISMLQDCLLEPDNDMSLRMLPMDFDPNLAK